ncbi:YIP1 family protein [Oceanicella sp. SM1341]|uniref:YIP1 family protein n=1 Tax=Oceanicella sp. SM1341 TaxID=1548889 RepID=UPI000E476F10|nr:YIP1 family protein [Oceanicella sp. SM1341]
MRDTLIGRVLAGYGGVRASFRMEEERQPHESRLLFYAMLAMTVIFAARLPELVRQAPPPQPGAEDPGPAFVGALFVSHVLFGPLMLYVLAALSHFVARRMGGQGSYASARLALFWALLLAAPLTLVAGVLNSLARLGGVDLAELPSAVVSIVSLWFWSLCLTEAERFEHSAPTFIALVAVPLATMALLWLAGSV